MSDDLKNLGDRDADPVVQLSANSDGERGGLAALDRWMASSPWHPRIVPFFCWIVFMAAAGFLPERWAVAQPFIYLVQCIATVWLLWRYRHLTPEVTLRFHWTVIPSAVLLVVLWIVLGYAMAGEAQWRWSKLVSGDWAAASTGAYPYGDLGVTPNRFGPKLDAAGGVPIHSIKELQENSPVLGWASMVLRLLGMSLIVPVFEELFIRSGMLRGLHRWRPTRTALLQFASDLPLIGDWLHGKPAIQKALAEPAPLTRQLVATPVGHLTVFAVVASTVVFSASHIPRDWLGCVACSIVWCWMVWYTNKPPRKLIAEKGSVEAAWAAMPASGRLGLGPIIWSHGLTNALLWLYTLTSDDWRFL